MKINLNEVVDFIYPHVQIDEKDDFNTDKEIEVIIPILCHSKDDDKVIIESKDFTPVCSVSRISFIGERCGRIFHIYDDFYDYHNDSNKTDISEYLSRYNHLIYRDKESSLAYSFSIYYKYTD